ncbi:MAG: glycerol-3-phosphate dehydrogenase [Rhodospirillaceae bacterium]|nr:glycerol-3-phosphate dehydrogenase [Rhodospirillaceae bacterium]MBT6831314.1 glycerol-3-phosphate dehydrogenase [Rhodospirillaceae bacterium]
MTVDPGAPTRHPVAWREPEFFDEKALDAELRRVFDICHGCRRCFSLCDSFPRLFDLVDESETFEIDGVALADFESIANACTLCDMCFMTMCPYTPPHEWNIDFPHLMLRYRAKQHQSGRAPTSASPRLAETDKNGRLARTIAPLMNWGAKVDNRLTRPLMEKLAGIHRAARLPQYRNPTLVRRARKNTPQVNSTAPAAGRKVAIYATCFANYNSPAIGEAARAVLAHNGVESEVVYPRCCGMPQLEQGDIARVVENAQQTAADLAGWIDKDYDIVALVPSCALMLKLEWPLLAPGDAAIERLAAHSFDITEYIVAIAREEGLADGLKALPGGVTLHMACHARAQNIGHKAAQMLKLVPDTDVNVIERCSGHGGSIGVTRDFHETALKVGKPVARRALEAGSRFVASECPLAASHIVAGMEQLAAAPGKDGAENELGKNLPEAGRTYHPIELFAMAYGLGLTA